MKDASVVLCGLGPRPPRHVTVETVETLLSCTRLFTDLEDPRALAWLERLGPPVETGATASRVAAAARRARVAAVVWGDPQTSSPWARDVAAACRAAGVPCRAAAAITPLGDALSRSLEFARLNWGHRGLDCRDLDDHLRRGAPLRPGVPTVLFRRPGSSVSWRELLPGLLSSYPAAHKVWRLGAEGPAEAATVSEPAPESMTALLIPSYAKR